MMETNDQAIEEAADVAVAWWGSAVCGNARQNSGDFMINVMVALTAPAPPADDDRARFEAELRRRVVERLRKVGEVHLDVDYHPCPLLHESWRAVCPEKPVSFPIKTHMRIEPDDVTVSNGYRAPTERLLGDPVWSVLAYRAPAERGDYGDFLRVYAGTDEQEARRLCALASSVLPAGGGTNERTWSGDKCNVTLERDGSEAA